MKGALEKEGISGIAYTNATILNYNDVNTYTYSYEMIYEGANYQIINNRIVVAKNFTEAEVIKVITKIGKIVDFKMHYDTYNYDLILLSAK
jgi:coproporphyrinogen III oxidase